MTLMPDRRHYAKQNRKSTDSRRLPSVFPREVMQALKRWKVSPTLLFVLGYADHRSVGLSWNADSQIMLKV